MIHYNFKLRRFQDSDGKIRSNLSGLLSLTARKTLDSYKNKKETYRDTLERLQTAPIEKSQPKPKSTSKKGKIYELGAADDFSTDYDYVTGTELESAVYGYDPTTGADIYKKMRHRKKHRTPHKFMYNVPSDLRKSYSAITVYVQLKTPDEDGNRLWLLPIDFSFSQPLKLKQIYERINRRTTPLNKREREAARRNRRSKNLSIIERLERFIIPTINAKYEMQTGLGSNWKLDRIIAFMDYNQRYKK